ncbi:MAG: alpha/beta hydrolase [Acidobacteriota bacterium]
MGIPRGDRHPHGERPPVRGGRPLGDADGAMILVHGRGADAADILGLTQSWAAPGFAYLAPEAAGRSWYPQSFLAPTEQNQPGLDSALARLGELMAEIEAAGVPTDRTVLLGFSQGACLSLEFAARNPRRYGGVVALSGGLIGPPGGLVDHAGDLGGTPVFLGCSDRDPHIPRWRVEESAAAMESLGAEVEMRIYPGMPHTVNLDEVKWVRGLLSTLEHTGPS